MKKYIIPIILALAVIASLASYHKGYKKGISKAVETIIERVDTLTLHDTLTTAKPHYIVERIVDSITVKVPVVERDTIMVNLPRTQKVYQDSTYRAVVSGFAPNLDTITVYRKTQYINNTVYIPQKDGRRDFFEVDARVMYSGSPYAPVTANIGRKYGPFEVYAEVGTTSCRKHRLLKSEQGYSSNSKYYGKQQIFKWHQLRFALATHIHHPQTMPRYRVEVDMGVSTTMDSVWHRRPMRNRTTRTQVNRQKEREAIAVSLFSTQHKH